jgi:hypothetical protein
MIQLAIDPGELIQALTFSMEISGASWYLDRETGEVLLDHEAQLRMAAEWCRDYGIEAVWRQHPK